MRPIRYLVFHHSGGPRSQTAEQIRAYHLTKRTPSGGFWKDVGYSYLVEEDGAIVPGRGLRSVLAANPPLNRESIAVCMIGDNTTPGQGWNVEQWRAAEWLVDVFRRLIPDIQVVGHRDIGSTATECPGTDIAAAFGAGATGDTA